jgi:hypothetical protein
MDWFDNGDQVLSDAELKIRAGLEEKMQVWRLEHDSMLEHNEMNATGFDELRSAGSHWRSS